VPTVWGRFCTFTDTGAQVGARSPKGPTVKSMLSIPEFLDEHRISRSLLYRLIKEGRGPRITKIAGRTLISAEAAADWRARMERETEQTIARPKPAAYHGREVGRGAALASREAA
jgi:predicted DNA-binding transcriptional regulator AlpA